MKKKIEILLTEEQERMLEARARAAGFCHKSEYVRFILFMDISFLEKVNAIYNKVVKNAQ